MVSLKLWNWLVPPPARTPLAGLPARALVRPRFGVVAAYEDAWCICEPTDGRMRCC
jgi:hypothetical protein